MLTHGFRFRQERYSYRTDRSIIAQHEFERCRTSGVHHRTGKPSARVAYET